MRCVLCAAPPPPPQTLFLSTFVCCAKKTNTPVDFFFLLKFYTRKSKKMSAFFSCVHSSNVIKKMTRMTKLGGGLSHTQQKFLLSSLFTSRGGTFGICVHPHSFIHSFIHSSGALVALSNWCRHSRNTRNTRTHGERE